MANVVLGQQAAQPLNGGLVGVEVPEPGVDGGRVQHIAPLRHSRQLAAVRKTGINAKQREDK